MLRITEPSGLWAAVFLVGLVPASAGLVAVHVRQAEAAGALGLVGFGAAFLGTAPALGVVQAPTLFAAPSSSTGASSYPSASWVGLALAFVGWALPGAATARTGVLPRMPALALTAGGLLAFLAFVGLPGTPVLDAAIAWIGLALLTEGPVPARGVARAG